MVGVGVQYSTVVAKCGLTRHAAISGAHRVSLGPQRPQTLDGMLVTANDGVEKVITMTRRVFPGASDLSGV